MDYQVHLSNALIAVDLTEQEIRTMLGITERKEVAAMIRKHLEDVDFGQGKSFGVFTTATEAATFRRFIPPVIRSLKWPEAYGRKNASGRWKTPIKAETIKIKDIEGSDKWADADPEHYIVRVLRYPKVQDEETVSV